MHARLVVVLVVVLGWAASMPGVARAQDLPANVDAEAREKSRVAFRKGVAQLRAQDWTAARASFETAWGLYPHPSILLNLGIARLRTDEPVRAELDLLRFLSEDVGASADELAGAREALAEARSKVGTLRVLVTPATARVSVDGTAVETVRRADSGTPGVIAEVRAKAGRHNVAVQAEGFASGRRDVELAAKGEAVVTINLAAVDQPPPPKAAETGTSTRSIVGWSMAGLAGAALITSGLTALRAQTLSGAYGDPQSARFQDPDARSDGIAFRSAADVALGVALVSGTAAILLLLTDLGKSSSNVTRSGAPAPGHAGLLRW